MNRRHAMLSIMLTVVGVASSYRIAVVNDIHADLTYDPKSLTCISKTLPPANPEAAKLLLASDSRPETYTALKAQSVALLGQVDCDPPISLLETMLKKLKANGEKYDAILVPGDLVAHGVPLTPGADGGNYTLLKETLARVAEKFIEYFPDTPVLPSMGNNDGKYHYQGIDKADKVDYYGSFFKHWFTAHPTNSKLPSISTIEHTF